MPTSRRTIALAVMCLLMVLCAACTGGQPTHPLPPVTPLPAEAVLMYRLVEGEPATRDESIILYPAGQVNYVEAVSGRKGSQFVMPGGVQRFLDSLQAARFASLSAVYRPPRASATSVYHTLSARVGGAVKTVQWESPETPARLGDFLREWEQFVSVIRASAH